LYFRQYCKSQEQDDSHLSAIKNEDSTINLSKFKPKGAFVKRVKKIILKLEKEKNKEHFTEDGELRLKPIFDALKGKVSYDKIRHVLLFA